MNDLVINSREHLSPGQRARRRFMSHRVAMMSGAFMLALLALVLIWPLFSHSTFAPHLPQALTWAPDKLTDAQFHPPCAAHWFGTDALGRDQLARVASGARVSLLVGAVGAAVSLVIGVLWGSVAGYVGGRTDAAMMRFVDILYSLPSIIFVIVLITTLEVLVKQWLAKTFAGGAPEAVRLLFLFFGIGAVSWLTMARIVRGEVLSLRTRQFVDASRALGAGHARLLFCHILPNISGVIIVYLALTVPSVVLYESFLSYLGLGIQPPMASWGSLIADGAQQINPIRIYWWLLVFPAGVLTTTLLALSFLGDGLRDALDPRANR